MLRDGNWLCLTPPPISKTCEHLLEIGWKNWLVTDKGNTASVSTINIGSALCGAATTLLRSRSRITTDERNLTLYCNQGVGKPIKVYGT